MRPDCSGVDYLLIDRPVPYSTNSKGLRDKEYPPVAEKGVFRVLFLGSSGAVNTGPEHGFVPTIEKALNKKLLQANIKHVKRIELINGSQSTYNTVKSYLAFDELQKAYNPNLVVLADFYGTLKMEEFFDHTFSALRDSNGLSTGIGWQPEFWPLPISYNSSIWKRYGTQALAPHRIGVAVRVGLLKISLALGPEKYCPQPAEMGCLIYWHLKYIDALNTKAKNSGAKFLALFGSGHVNSDKGMPLPVAWYFPESIVRNALPWDPIATRDYDQYYGALSHSGYGVDLSNEFEQALKRHSTEGPSSIHLTEMELEKLGESSSEKIFNAILPFLGSKDAPSKATKRPASL